MADRLNAGKSRGNTLEDVLPARSALGSGGHGAGQLGAWGADARIDPPTEPAASAILRRIDAVDLSIRFA